MSRVILIVMDSVGCGTEPLSKDYNDDGKIIFSATNSL